MEKVRDYISSPVYSRATYNCTASLSFLFNFGTSMSIDDVTHFTFLKWQITSSYKWLCKAPLRILDLVSKIWVAHNKLCKFCTIIYRVSHGGIACWNARKRRKWIIYSLGAFGPSSLVSAVPQPITDQSHWARLLVERERAFGPQGRLGGYWTWSSNETYRWW